MSNGRVKLYKNAARKTDNESSVSKTYVPQYKIKGLVPQPDSREFPGEVPLAEGNSLDDNPRTRILSMPWTIPTKAVECFSIPSVGNNMEQSWVYVDNGLVDDISCESIVDANDNTPMIDNNEIVSIPEIPLDEEKSFMTEQDLKYIMNDYSDLSSLKDDDYILIVCGSIISIDNFDKIQESVSSLIFGEHEICNGKPLSEKDITVLKKVKLKVGVFLE